MRRCKRRVRKRKTLFGQPNLTITTHLVYQLRERNGHSACKFLRSNVSVKTLLNAGNVSAGIFRMKTSTKCTI